MPGDPSRPSDPERLDRTLSALTRVRRRPSALQRTAAQLVAARWLLARLRDPAALALVLAALLAWQAIAVWSGVDTAAPSDLIVEGVGAITSALGAEGTP